jgi:hypothetical protein
VSLDADSRAALADLTERTGRSQSETVRRALRFYAANFEAADADAGPNLEAYHQMLSSGEHVLLDVDFLHCFLEFVVDDSGDPDPEFLDAVDRVAQFHAYEYEGRFESLRELLEWLSLCGFLAVRETRGRTYHVVFPTESIKWFMLRFVRGSTPRLPFDLEVEEGVAKVLLTEVPRDR